jgi:rhamnosyltransferase
MVFMKQIDSVSVVIPVKNGGSRLQEVLASIESQKGVRAAEVLLIDSGSTDGALELAIRKFSPSIVRILPHEFGHGKTRNLAISNTSTDLVALLTQDAVPNDDYWLHHLTNPFVDPMVAGTFGPHTAHPEHSVVTRLELETFFSGLGEFGETVSIVNSWPRYTSDLTFRQRSHFFSDNNACLRRSVWEKYPYPDINFAEDQSWARTVLEAGYTKCFAPSALVRHSHEFVGKDLFQRSFDEAIAMRDIFGYKSTSGLISGLVAATKTGVVDSHVSQREGEGGNKTFHISKRVTQHLGRYLGQSVLATKLHPKLSRELRIIGGKS